MTYSWQIVKFDTRDQTNSDGVTLSDAVVRIKWRRIGVDSEGNTGKVVGYTILTAEATAQSDYIAFADLTEDTVTGWLTALTTDAQITDYNLKITESINKMVTTERAVPWS